MTALKSPLFNTGAALLLLLSLTACGGSGGGTANGAIDPVGAPNGTITTPAANVVINPGQSVTFAGTVTDPNSNPVTVLWDFGDGNTSTLLDPGAHTYAAVGTFTVTLTATDSIGLVDPTPATQTITVQTEPVNRAPSGTITAPTANVTITPGQSVAFAGKATDPDSNPVTVLWNFGDGSAPSTLLSPGNHTFPTVGTFTVTLTATDSLGLADQTPAKRTITVQTAPANGAPNGTITAPAANVTINPGQSVAFAGTATDPDSNPVTVRWNFGDGTTSTLLAPGNHTYSTVGTFTATLTATDSLGLADPAPATRTITVQTAPVNGAPSGTITAPAANVTIAPGQAVAFTGTATDPDSNPVTVLWNFGDGSATSTLLSPGNHTYALAGTFTATLTATDSLGLADPTPATRTITVQAAPPVNGAPNGTITAPAGNVTINAGQTVAFTGTTTDPNSNPVTVLWNFGDGATSTQLAPSHTYATAGTFNVTLTATDSLGLADLTPATRTITVSSVVASATLTQLKTTIFTPSCTSCHGSSGGLNLSAGSVFSNLVNVPATTSGGVRVTPGNPGASVLVTFLASGHRSVSAANQALISSWISGGALNN